MLVPVVELRRHVAAHGKGGAKKGGNRGGIAAHPEGDVKKGMNPEAIEESKNRGIVRKSKNPGAGAGDGHGQAFCGLSACCGGRGHSSWGGEEEDSRRGRDRGKTGSGGGGSRSRKGTRSLPCGTLFF